MADKKLVKALDDVFSKYIRKKHSKDGIGRCYTCGKFDEPKNLQCGHFHSRKHMATRWEEANCRPQCVHCNMFSEGNKPQYTIRLMNELGCAEFEKLNIKKNNFWKPTDFELKILINEYTIKLKELEK